MSEFLIVFALILVNGVLAGAEIALVAMRQSRVRELAEAGSKVGRAIQRLRANPERFLSTVQIGITVVGSTAAVFGGATFATDLAPTIRNVPLLGPYAEELSLALVVAMITFLSIVLGELVPKSLALRAPEGYARWAAQPLLALSWLVQPAVWLLTKSSNAVLKLFGDHTTFTESRLSLEELRGLVNEASEEGSVPEEAGEIASRALEFGELTAGDVMTHRRYVIGLPKDASPSLVRSVMLTSGHRRTPVYEGSLDNVVGYVSWRDLLARVWKEETLELAQLIRPGYFVPETTTALDLLGEMRSRRLQLAIVVDEHGGMAGIVTLEDLLEELVGEIVSEHDPKQSESIRREHEGSAIVAGTASIRDVNRELELDMEEPEEWTTMAGLCLALAGGRIPHAGERFTARDGTEIEILDASARRVRNLRVRKARREPAPAE